MQLDDVFNKISEMGSPTSLKILLLRTLHTTDVGINFMDCTYIYMQQLVDLYFGFPHATMELLLK